MQPNTDHLRSRVDAVDVVRGIIMVIMAIDHTRDYFMDTALNPTDMKTTTIALFLTRWITHFCAPTFFLLTGTGAYLALKRRTRAELSRYLLTRGAWLIILEFTLFRFILTFNLDYRVTVLTVLWAIGWSMIALAGLVFLKPSVVGWIGAVMVVTHNLLDGATPERFGALTPLINLLHAPAVLSARPDFFLVASYPVIPWIGVTALGFALGQVYAWPADRRRHVLLRMGAALTVAFIALRLLNLYGDPSRWATQSTGAFTVLSFLNLTKYPPSLLFLLMTLGPVTMLLSVLDSETPRWLRPAHVFGKVPMFFFLAHFALIHLLVVVIGLLRYGNAGWAFSAPDIQHFPTTPPPGWGLPLIAMYAIWAFVVVALYPVCRWYAQLRARRTDWWLSYL